MEILDIIGLAILFPLIGTIVIGFFGRMMSRAAVGFLACTTVFLSFLVGLVTLFVFQSGSGRVEDHYLSYLFTWLSAGDLTIDFSLVVDPLAITMTLVVTGVGFLIHVYSVGYMGHDKDFARYFAYLNLFIAAMLILVLGSNLAVMFIGWEGVGLSSFLLIGFWYEKKSANIAGMKAFIVNRIGDFGVLVAMFLLLSNEHFRTLDFLAINRSAAELSGTGSADNFLLAVSLFIFLGAVGKSAQIPLYVWLPDAMEGPTPVSALIHAATMVTSGVYLLARLNVLFASAPAAMFIVAVIGVATAFFAATIAMSQFDIKRILAYSTVSQLGYMFLAAGVGAFWVAIFHLMTHAFFKALLFLGSGSVIHGMHDEKDLRQMGGLAKRMPVTYWTFLIAAMAIAGVPFLSGFFSKDEILHATFLFGLEFPLGGALYAVALFTAFLTAFYMFRLVARTFLGKPESDKARDARESPRVMTIPLIILAVLAVIGGYGAIPHVVSKTAHWITNPFERFIEPATQTFEHTRAAVAGQTELPVEGIHLTDWGAWLLILVAVAVAAIGIILSLLYFHFFDWSKLPWLKRELQKCKLINYWSLRKWFVDELYQYVIVEPGKILALIAWKFDQVVVDGVVNGTAGLFAFIGGRLRSLQTGVVRSYALGILLGAVCIVLLMLITRMMI